MKSQAGPLVVIQVAAAVLVIAYYRSAGFQESASHLAAFKLAGGLLFAFVAGAIAGGVIPEIARAMMRRIPKFDRTWLQTAGYNAFVYGIIGAQVDVFYQFQALTFGGGNDAKTLIVKTAVDMAIFTPVLSIPTAVLLYAWKRRGFRIHGWKGAFTRKFYAKEVWPTLVPCWAFWIPVLLCVYAMPSDLQYCFAVLAEAAWSMVFVVMVTKPT